MLGYATKTLVTTLGSDVTVSSESIVVYGIITTVDGSAAGPNLDLEDIDGNSLGELKVHSSSAEVFDQRWVADNGLVLKALNAATIVTVFYSQGGA